MRPLKFPVVALLATSAALLHCAAPAGEEDAQAGEDAITSGEQCSTSECVEKSGPAELAYDELVKLSALDGHREGARYVVPGAGKALEDKVNTLLTTPFVSNEAYHAGIRKHLPVDPKLGPTVRAVAWNIERGEHLSLVIEMLKAADDPSKREAFLAKMKPEVRADAKQMENLRAELDAIAKTDVFVLNEVDRGMRRSHYEDVVAKLGTELGMNWAYGVEFLEVDPIALGTQKFEGSDFATYDAQEKKNVPEAPETLAALAKEANDAVAVDTSRIKALHGNAVLSRYPIKSARLEPLQTRMGRKAGAGCWDWNADEKQRLDFADSLLLAGQRYASAKVFLTESMREVRHGGRTSLIVDLMVNGLDGAPLTVVNAHIEAKGTPACRRDQMDEILKKIEKTKNPVLMAGDLNTSGTDGRPMTLSKLLFSRFEDPEFYLKQLTSRLAIPYAGWGWLAFDVFKWFKKLDDPTSLFNPEHKLFDRVKDAGFDFRGEKLRTGNGTEKTLANSNERDGKGFKTTFAAERTFGPIPKFKLDWILVRSYAASKKGSYRFAPHFARTLEELNQGLSPRMSDHFPLTVVLPLKDPCLGAAQGTCTVPDRIVEDDFVISDE